MEKKEYRQPRIRWGGIVAVVLAAFVIVFVSGYGQSEVSSAANQVKPAAMPGMSMQATAMPAMPTQETPAAGSTPLVPTPSPVVTGSQSSLVSITPNVRFTLQTTIAQGRLVFIGVGGDIEGEYNPALRVNPGDVVMVTLINNDGAEHDISFPDFNTTSDRVIGKGASSVIVFRADRQGAYPYFCTLPGHRAAGMEGRLIVGEIPQPTPVAPSVSRDPTDLPAPIGNRAPQHVMVELETQEVNRNLAQGVDYTFWTFNGKIPGPFIRVRVGDTVELHMRNSETARMVHSIDLHAVTGPGGGATIMQVPPGQEKSFTFKTLSPGLFVYHCATPMVAAHISNGMYGLILVEPEGGLPKVDHEYYVMQGEIYTQQAFGQEGHAEFSVQKLLDEKPEYLTFNGAAGALTAEHPLKAKVGETVRIFFGVGGPNLTSSFHVIGEIFDRVYNQASLTSAPLTNVQTTTVGPGGATVVEFKLDVPGRYILVDHALSRMERGLVGFLMAEGPPNPEVFRSDFAPSAMSGH